MFSKALVFLILLIGIALLLTAARGAVVIGRSDDERNRRVSDDEGATA